MRCPKCNVEVKTRAKVCPLCHGTLLNDEADGDPSSAPLYFPEYNRHTPLTNPMFDKIYLWLAFALSVASIVLNVIFTPQSVWCPLAIVVLYYGYFLIRNTLLDANNFAIKFLTQIFSVTLLLAGVQILLLPNLIIAAYAVPALHVLAVVVMAIYLLRMWKNPRKYVMPLLSLAIFSLTPVIFLIAFGVEEWEFSLVCAGFSMMIFVVAATVYRKLLIRELVRFFHI